MLIFYLWCIISFVQHCMSYGTAYRLAKKGGDNGLSFLGWLWIIQLATVVPGLGIYLYIKNKE